MFRTNFDFPGKRFAVFRDLFPSVSSTQKSTSNEKVAYTAPYYRVINGMFPLAAEKIVLDLNCVTVAFSAIDRRQRNLV